MAAINIDTYNNIFEVITPDEPVEKEAYALSQRSWRPSKRILELGEIIAGEHEPINKRKITYNFGWTTMGYSFDNGYTLNWKGNMFSGGFELADSKGEVIAHLSRSKTGFALSNAKGKERIGELKFGSGKKSASFIDKSGETLAEMSFDGKGWSLKWTVKEPLTDPVVEALVTVCDHDQAAEPTWMGFLGTILIRLAVFAAVMICFGATG